MKIKKIIFLTCLLLAALTISAVAATEDTLSNDTLTVTDEITETIDQTITEEPVSLGKITEDDFNVEYDDYVSLLEQEPVLKFDYPENIVGTVNVSVNGNNVFSKEITIDDENESFDLNRLGIRESGSYTILGLFNSDLTFINKTLQVYSPIYMDVEEEVIYPFETISIYSYGATGQVIISADTIEDYTLEVDDDAYEISFDKLGIHSKGKYELIFRFVNENYDFIFKRANVTILNEGLWAHIANFFPGDVGFLAYSYDKAGNLVIMIDGEEYYNDAIPQYNLTMLSAMMMQKNVDYGKHDAVIKIVTGTSETILLRQSFQMTDIGVTYYGDAPCFSSNETFELEVELSDGAEGNLTITYNGKTQNISNVGSEYTTYVEFNSSDFKEGGNTITFTLTSANEFFPTQSYDYTVYVEYTPDVKVEMASAIEEGGSIKFFAPASPETLEVYIDGESYGNYSLDNGYAIINLAGLSIGTHNVRMHYYSIDYSVMKASYYNGNLTINIVQKTAPAPEPKPAPAPVKKADVVKLKLKKVSVKRSAKKLVLQVTLKINGKAVKGKVIKFKFNKKTYKAKTNKKGVAKVTIKKKILKKLKKGKKVTYSATYSKKTVKYTVKVKK